MAEYGDADLIEQRLGLSLPIGQKIAAIITFSGGIEHHLERALWMLNKTDPAGIRPDTDGKMVSDLIAMLEQFAAGLAPGNEQLLLERWCVTARSGFIISNNIVHGFPVRLGEKLGYMRNTRWHGEIRKREFGDLWAEECTLDLIRQAMAVLLRIVHQLAGDDVLLMNIASPLALKALAMARSVLGEFASQTYNPTFEKY